jgi:hypothetical protein
MKAYAKNHHQYFSYFYVNNLQQKLIALKPLVAKKPSTIPKEGSRRPMQGMGIDTWPYLPFTSACLWVNVN